MMVGIFNNREFAIAIWLLVALTWMSIKSSEVWQSFKSLVRLFFQRKILIPYVLGILYTFCGIYLLWKLKLWTTAQLKDTILWCVFAIIATMLSLNKIKENKKYFKDAIKENLKFSLVIEFITGVYTFSLLVELVLVPLAVLIGGVQAFAGTEQKYESVRKLLTRVLFLFGLFIIGYSIYEITISMHHFASLDTLRDFLLSPLLVVWFLPFVYAMSLYMTYEVYFITMQFRIEDKSLLKFAKWRAVIYFNKDLSGFERWKNQLFIGSLKTKDDVVRSIKEIKRLQDIENCPPKVDFELGWSPYSAKDFLSNEGINTKYYSNTYENEWGASSDYTRLDDAFGGNTVSYYIKGNEVVAKNLHLVLNINKPTEASRAIAKFLDYAKSLYLVATNSALPQNICNAILKKKNLELTIDKLTLIVKKDDWMNQDKYSLIFNIQHS